MGMLICINAIPRCCEHDFGVALLCLQFYMHAFIYTCSIICVAAIFRRSESEFGVVLLCLYYCLCMVYALQPYNADLCTSLALGQYIYYYLCMFICIATVQRRSENEFDVLLWCMYNICMHVSIHALLCALPPHSAEL